MSTKHERVMYYSPKFLKQYRCAVMQEKLDEFHPMPILVSDLTPAANRERLGAVAKAIAKCWPGAILDDVWEKEARAALSALNKKLVEGI